MSTARSSYHHGNLREELLAQAADMLAEEGMESVSLRKVAARAGVSRTAPYHHFKDKDALLAGLVERGFRELVSEMGGLAGGSEPVLDRFDRMGRAYVTFALRAPHLYRLMFGPRMLDAQRHPEVSCIADQAFGVCRQLVSEGQQTGEIAGDDPTPVALAAWSTVHGLSSLLMDKMDGVRKKVQPSALGPMGEAPTEDVISGVLATLRCGLQAR